VELHNQTSKIKKSDAVNLSQSLRCGGQHNWQNINSLKSDQQANFDYALCTQKSLLDFAEATNFLDVTIKGGNLKPVPYSHTVPSWKTLIL
jgi:hypothetical protein